MIYDRPGKADPTYDVIAEFEGRLGNAKHHDTKCFNHEDGVGHVVLAKSDERLPLILDGQVPDIEKFMTSGSPCDSSVGGGLDIPYVDGSCICSSEDGDDDEDGLDAQLPEGAPMPFGEVHPGACRGCSSCEDGGVHCSHIFLGPAANASLRASYPHKEKYILVRVPLSFQRFASCGRQVEESRPTASCATSYAFWLDSGRPSRPRQPRGFPAICAVSAANRSTHVAFGCGPACAPVVYSNRSHSAGTLFLVL